MQLISVRFFIFFLFTLTGYFLVSEKFRWQWLLTASLVFYLLSDRKGFIYLLFCIVTTYCAGILIERSPSGRKKGILLCAILLNVLFLSYFKLFGYYGSLLMRLLSDRGERDWSFGSIAAPLGISYFTLQSISYCVDICHGKFRPEKNIMKYALFISYFPLITQGPISRYDRLRDQLFVPHRFSYEKMAHGGQLILWGLIKKLVIADRLSIPVASLLDVPLCGSASLLGGMLFSFQLFADFSGCMDIVGGCSEILGIALPRNFNNPFAADSIKDFWRRWHISLSTWLRDYIYIPLGGSRCGKRKKYRNLLITFFVSGLWHGAGISYLVWGLLHGCYQVMEDFLPAFFRKKSKNSEPLPETEGLLLMKRTKTFLLVSLAWIFFRSAGLNAAFEHMKLIFTDFDLPVLIRNICHLGLNGAYLAVLPVLTAGMLIIENLRENNSIRAAIDLQPLPVRWSLYMAAIIVLVLMGNYGIDRSGMFLYARF